MKTKDLDVSKLFPEYDSATAVRKGDMVIVTLFHYGAIESKRIVIKMALAQIYQLLEDVRKMPG